MESPQSCCIQDVSRIQTDCFQTHVQLVAEGFCSIFWSQSIYALYFKFAHIYIYIRTVNLYTHIDMIYLYTCIVCVYIWLHCKLWFLYKLLLFTIYFKTSLNHLLGGSKQHIHIGGTPLRLEKVSKYKEMPNIIHQETSVKNPNWIHITKDSSLFQKNIT